MSDGQIFESLIVFGLYVGVVGTLYELGRIARHVIEINRLIAHRFDQQ